MSTIFIEKGKFLKNYNKVSSDNNSKKSFSYNLKIPAKVFFDANEFFNVRVQDINLRHINLKTSLIYSNIPRFCNIKNVIKSNFFFKPNFFEPLAPYKYIMLKILK
jgi:hypothetical protein